MVTYDLGAGSKENAVIFAGGGEVGALMRGHDWSTSPIGYPDTWPQALRTAVSMMLPNKHIMFTTWGPELAFLYNDACRPILGGKHTWALGRPFREVWSEVWDEITPLVETALRGEATLSENLQLVLERNGYPEDCWFTFSFSPLRDDSGKIAGLFYTVSETTERILVERRLAAESEQLRNEFQALYEQAPGFLATSRGPQHLFTFANASYREFVCRDQLVGLTVAEAIPELVDQGLIGLLDQVYETGKRLVGNGMQIDLVNPATGLVVQRYCNYIYQPVRDAQGVITGLFCQGYDVTQQRQTADALSALQSELIHVSRVNAMGTMAATLAHELNQPLSAVVNYTAGIRRLVESQKLDDRQLMQALQGIDEGSRRAGDIIRNLREMTNRRELARDAFNLKSAMDECLCMVRATIDPKLSIIQEIPDDLVMFANRVQIQQVVINLVRNASDTMLNMNSQLVRITATQVDQDVIVSVIDTGPGVTNEAAQSIFQWSVSSKADGMGLGLSICRTIIEDHRGRIWLENSGPQGSEFCFSVPLPSNSTKSGNDNEQE